MKPPIPQISIAVASVAACSLIIWASINQFKWRKENFKNEVIPAVAGLYIIAFGIIGAILARKLPTDNRLVPDDSYRYALLYLIAVLGFGLLGLLDDLFGSRDTGGFKGHFKKLIFEGKPTTGVLKAIGGGLIAIWIGHNTSGGNVGLWIADAVLIALAANTINLLDLRPGRALFVFFFGLAVVSVIAFGALKAPLPIIAVAIAAALVAHFDVRGKAMLGDVGSNTLGAVLGLMLVLDTPLVVRLIAIALFFIINVYSEKRSISKLIEHNPVLANLDSKLGVR